MKRVLKTVISMLFVLAFVCTVFSFAVSDRRNVYAVAEVPGISEIPQMPELSEIHVADPAQAASPVEEVQVDKPVREEIGTEAPEVIDNGLAGSKIDNNKPMVALTFDDGPHPQYTDKILEALKKYGGSGTFFVVGSRAEKYKSTVKKIFDSGNEIGNHSYSHKELTRVSGREMKAEIKKTGDLIAEITGVAPILTRPTYGSVNKNVRLYAGMPLILWSIDPLDWKTRDRDMIVHNVLSNIKDGDIVLLHDIYNSTADASEIIIRELTERGFQLVTVSQLCEARGVTPEVGKVYDKFTTNSIAENKKKE